MSLELAAVLVTLEGTPEDPVGPVADGGLLGLLRPERVFSRRASCVWRPCRWCGPTNFRRLSLQVPSGVGHDARAV